MAPLRRYEELSAIIHEGVVTSDFAALWRVAPELHVRPVLVPSLMALRSPGRRV